MTPRIDGRRWAGRATWLARGCALVSIGLILLFLVGEGFRPSQVGSREWLGLVFFPIGVCLGMIVAWWQERLGGLITLCSVAVFYATHLVTTGAFPRGWAFLFFAAPGFLFLLADWLDQPRRDEGLPS